MSILPKEIAISKAQGIILRFWPNYQPLFEAADDEELYGTYMEMLATLKSRIDLVRKSLKYYHENGE